MKSTLTAAPAATPPQGGLAIKERFGIALYDLHTVNALLTAIRLAAQPEGSPGLTGDDLARVCSVAEQLVDSTADRIDRIDLDMARGASYG